MKPIVGSVLPAPENPARLKPWPKFWIVPPVKVTTKNCWRNWVKARTAYRRFRSWIGQGFEDDGAAAAPQQRLDEADRQRREHRRLLGVLAGEIEDQFAGEPHQELAAGVEQLADARDRAQVEGRDLAGGREPRGVVERVGIVDAAGEAAAADRPVPVLPAAAGLGDAGLTATCPHRTGARRRTAGASPAGRRGRAARVDTGNTGHSSAPAAMTSAYRFYTP